MKQASIFVIIIFFLSGIELCPGQEDSLQNFGADHDPLRIGLRVAENYVSKPFRNFDGIQSPPSEVIYPEVCAWFGALKFADVSGNKELFEKLEKRFLPLLGSQKELMQKPDHVDHTVFGTIPLQLYRCTGNKVYYYIGIDFADRQWQMPASSGDAEKYRDYLDQGLSWQTRFWIDDMFMISAVQSQAYLASNDQKYLDRAAYEMTVYLDSIQQPNGLFHHAGKSPFFWCRGNGWMASGMTEVLKLLPSGHPHRLSILAAYKRMMTTLKSLQNAEGLWGQLIDEKEIWTETSGSAMFTYAMITGIKNGWLNKKDYGPVVRKAWMALVNYLDANGELRNVCQGTNTGDSKMYYENRKRITGDLHGQAPMLWCAAALLE
ncbi:glycoside hydrolase family 88/105 protein [Sinomicrobium sp. M5D2P17]